MPSYNTKITTLLLGLLSLMGCQKKEAIMDATQGNFNELVQRRGEYAKQSDTKPVDFNAYLYSNSMRGVALTHTKIGDLKLPTGEIVAADPFYVNEEFTRPFKRKVPPGNYPVILTEADFGAWGRRVAFAHLQFTEARPVRWELAVTTLEKGAFADMYGVDAGLGSFSDATGAQLLGATIKAFYAKHPNGNYYDDLLVNDFKQHDNWSNHWPQTSNQLNVIMFSSGMGDGVYSTYWGLDSTGKPACLLTDFQLFDQNGSIFRKIK